MLRKLVVLVAMLAAVAAAADFGFRLYSERVVADEIQRSLKLNERPSVSFGGWPFTPHVLSGDLPGATVSASQLVAQGVRLTKVSIRLRDLHFPSHRLIAKGSGTIRAKGGSATAALTSADLDATLRTEGIPLTVTIHDGHAAASSHGVSVNVDLHLEGATLVITPSGAGAASARVGLPVPIQGMRYSSLRLKGDHVVLTATLRNARIVVPA